MNELYVILGLTGNVIGIYDNKESAQKKLDQCNKVARMYYPNRLSCEMKTFVVDKDSDFPTEWKEQENSIFKE